MTTMPDVPTIYVNGFKVTVSRYFVKIAFGESDDGKAAPYRTAVIMAHETARELIDLIIKLAKEHLESDRETSE